MITRRMDLPRDTLDLLVLRALALEAQPQHGWTEQHSHSPVRVAAEETQKTSAQGLHGTVLTLLTAT